MLSLRRQRQKDYTFKAGLGYIDPGHLYLKSKTLSQETKLEREKKKVNKLVYLYVNIKRQTAFLEIVFTPSPRGQESMSQLLCCF